MFKEDNKDPEGEDKEDSEAAAASESKLKGDFLNLLEPLLGKEMEGKGRPRGRSPEKKVPP
jgi:hypothetical protein